MKLPGGPYGADAGRAIQGRFEEDYRLVYTRTPPGGAAELINIRVSVEAPAGSGELNSQPAKLSVGAATRGSRPAYFGALGGFVTTDVYDRRLLGVGVEVAGRR